ncbi:MAG TPA: ABC transporter substrate-binding protein [Natronosporangium sp.]
MLRRYRTIAALAVAATIAAIALSGCDDGNDGSNESADGVTSIKVGFIPIGVYSYLWRAEDAGYFAEQNLEVELVPMAGGGEIIPALQSRSLQFGISDALGVINARNGGIDATYVSFNFAQSAEDPVHAVLTGNPEVSSPADLAGKTVATNLSYNTDWTMMRMWLRQHGVDPESVNFQELPFPDMLAALRNGTVDAAGVAEPFYTQGENDGLRVLGNYFTEVRSPVVFSGMVALDSYIEDNEDVVERFVTAIHQAINDFNNDPQVARDTIAEHTEIDPELVASMRLGEWNASSSTEDIQFWVDAANSEGILDGGSVDANELLWRTG